jgi:hypothetical protein
MTQQITTHIHRAQRARRKREAAERREAFKLLCEIPLDQLTPEQVHRRFYYNVREDKLFWRTVTGKLRETNNAVLRSNNSEYDRADIIRRYMEHKETLPVRGVEAALRLMHVASVDKRRAEERQARTLELQVRRIEREAEAAKAAKNNDYDKPFVFKPPRKETSNTAEELMALAREIKEHN